MDYLRSCYRSSMELFVDRPGVLTPGQWKWCPPGAIMTPDGHPYRSSIWDPYGEDYSGLGEALPRRGYTKGGVPDLGSGRRYCGRLDYWLIGSPWDLRGSLPTHGDGWPFCCGPREAQALSLPLALGLDGEAWQGKGLGQLAEGGVSLDGTAGQGLHYRHYAEGGVSLDGECWQGLGLGQLAEGGISLDGECWQGLGLGQLAEGGVSLDGTADQGDGYTQLAEGGVSLDGEADQVVTDGGITACGIADIPVDLYGHFSGVGCLDGFTMAIHHLTGVETWYGIEATSPCGVSIILDMTCTSPVWSVDSTLDGSHDASTSGTATSPPFELPLTIIWLTGPATGTWLLTIDTTP